jgi:16S rRNA (uracil1498-N3)-methyltransferase
VGEGDPPLFYFDGLLEPGERVVLAEEESAHAGLSRRLKPGDRIRVTDGQGVVAGAEIVGWEKRRLVVRFLERRVLPRSPGPEIWLGAAVIRGPRYEFLLEKATELGVRTLIPLQTSLSGGSPGGREKPARWKRLLIAAMKQSGQAYLPDLRPPMGLSEVIDRANPCDIWMAELGSFCSPIETRIPNRLLLLVGPEGGWDDREREYVRGRGGILLSLGPNRLRAETAGLALVVHALSVLGMMGRGGGGETP